ncbi:polysaccharide pyruvyl transferase family protein [Marispirochaeta sp.]|uniref:polysaccharide pyruvyl transferase family protein n=1 Tax=Marispirochaeta sp. TaxID=2038653 RepID=UPI0029C97661|nr:polysaccharide pyruvyl transferase family protein [Marispirochaeta sp.]
MTKSVKNNEQKVKVKNGIVVFGASFATRNRGVSALAAASVELIEKYFPDNPIYLVFPGLSYKSSANSIFSSQVKRIKYICFRFNPFSRPSNSVVYITLGAILYRIIRFKQLRKLIKEYFPLINTVTTSRFVADIWGGDSFSDIYDLKRMCKRSFGSLLTLILDKKLILFPQSYGPYKTKGAQTLARIIIRYADWTLARTLENNWLYDINLQGIVKPVFCPDIAFTLKSIPPNENIDRFFSFNNSTTKPLVGLNISGLLYSGGYTGRNMFGLEFEYGKFIKNLCMLLINEENCNILFIPHTYGERNNTSSEDDLSASIIVKNSLDDNCKDNISIMDMYLNQHELKYIIGQTDFFIGSRLHACIAALSQEIPVLGIAYSHKFIDVFGSVDLSDLVVDGRTLSEYEACNKVRKYLNTRVEIQHRIRKNISMAVKTIESTFSALSKSV